MTSTQSSPELESGRVTDRPLIWLDGTLVPKSQATVSVYDHGFLYGDGCFEGIRAYGGRIFKLRSHLERMFASAEMIRLTPAYSIDEVEAAVRETVEANGLTDAYIRLVFSRGVGTLGLNPFLCPKAGTIVIADSITLYPQELYDNGMKVIVAERPRIPIECLDPAIKSLNYLNNILAKIEAIDAGVLEAIMLNVEGFVSECTGDNIFVIKDGRIVTPPTGAGILHGITRRFVMDELCPAEGIEISEGMMKLDDVYAADEVFLTGTAAEVIGVTSVGDRVIGDGAVGPITRRLTERFRSTVANDAPED
ncbi:MAG: branched-chain-amino-acid transaminase [Phycisphaerales bacterium]